MYEFPLSPFFFIAYNRARFHQCVVVVDVDAVEGRCLFESGLTDRILKSQEDRRLLDYRMGLVNMIEKPSTKSCQELTADEIKSASDNLTRKLAHYRPRVVAFNGKSIYEIYIGESVDKQFDFGKQPRIFADPAGSGHQAYMFVMPSSSARCSQLPKVVDKVPFYAALKRLRDHLASGEPLSDLDITFPDFKVALEVENNNDTTTTTTTTSSHRTPKRGTDAAADNSDFDDNEDVDASNDNECNASGAGGGGGGVAGSGHGKIKFVRLNNIPYSQIPGDILANLKLQRQQRKNVTLTTTKDFFNTSKLAICAQQLSSPNGGLRTPSKAAAATSHQHNAAASPLLSSRKKSSAATAAAAAASNASCSDVETASTATNDSSSDFSTHAQTYTNEIASSNIIMDTSAAEHNGSSSSKLHSIILNVCSVNSSSSGSARPSTNLNVPTSASPSSSQLLVQKTTATPSQLQAPMTLIHHQPQQQINQSAKQLTAINGHANATSTIHLNGMVNGGVATNATTTGGGYILINNGLNTANGYTIIQPQQQMIQQQPQQQQQIVLNNGNVLILAAGGGGGGGAQMANGGQIIQLRQILPSNQPQQQQQQQVAIQIGQHQPQQQQQQATAIAVPMPTITTAMPLALQQQHRQGIVDESLFDPADYVDMEFVRSDDLNDFYSFADSGSSASSQLPVSTYLGSEFAGFLNHELSKTLRLHYDAPPTPPPPPPAQPSSSKRNFSTMHDASQFMAATGATATTGIRLFDSDNYKRHCRVKTVNL